MTLGLRDLLRYQVLHAGMPITVQQLEAKRLGIAAAELPPKSYMQGIGQVAAAPELYLTPAQLLQAQRRLFGKVYCTNMMCAKCITGTFAAQVGQTACLGCPKGKYSGWGSSRCNIRNPYTPSEMKWTKQRKWIEKGGAKTQNNHVTTKRTTPKEEQWIESGGASTAAPPNHSPHMAGPDWMLAQMNKLKQELAAAKARGHTTATPHVVSPTRNELRHSGGGGGGLGGGLGLHTVAHPMQCAPGNYLTTLALLGLPKDAGQIVGDGSGSSNLCVRSTHKNIVTHS